VLFELTGEYSIILPMMLAVVLATLTSRLLSRDTIYTLKLRRRGIDLDGAHRASPLAGVSERDAMEALSTPLPGSMKRREAADALALSGHGVLPITGTEAACAGVITARAVAQALSAPGLDAADRPATTVDLVELPHSVSSVSGRRVRGRRGQ
jgi:CIC family chloride channel protein